MTIVKDRLPQRVTLTPITVASGVRTEGTAITGVYAKVFQKEVFVRDVNGDGLVTETRIMLLPTQTITSKYEITIDDEQRPVKQILKCKDRFDNLHHLEVILG